MKITERLALSELEPGMALVDPLLDEIGRVLLPRGCTLSESILADLRRRGTGELTIARVVDEEVAVQAARHECIVNNLASLFRKSGSGPASRQLYQSILRFQMEQAR
jgi:hypothetical protein